MWQSRSWQSRKGRGQEVGPRPQQAQTRPTKAAPGALGFRAVASPGCPKRVKARPLVGKLSQAPASGHGPGARVSQAKGRRLRRLRVSETKGGRGLQILPVQSWIGE